MTQNKNDGKRWSTRDKQDLAAALARGESIVEAANFLLRPVGEVARMAAELGLLADGSKYSLGKYTVVLSARAFVEKCAPVFTDR